MPSLELGGLKYNYDFINTQWEFRDEVVEQTQLLFVYIKEGINSGF